MSKKKNIYDNINTIPSKEEIEESIKNMRIKSSITNILSPKS